jgi:glutamate-ammonia-ligase adenylyltransferase
MTLSFEDPEAWPRTGNPDRVESGLRSWSDAARQLSPGPDRDFAQTFPGTPAGKAMLSCLFGASPFLGGLAIRDPGSLRVLWEHGPDRCVGEALTGLRSLAPDCGEGVAARALREARQKVALAVALADIARLWNLEGVTAALTRLAETGCSVGFRVLLAKLASRGTISPPHPDDPERDSGLIALGLGKLGGRELNYSSDIDLILLTLAHRWIILAVRARSGRPVAERLFQELLEASRGQGTATRRREELHRMADANRAFAHYRW